LNLAWSPDGTHFVYASTRTGYWEIFVVKADGSEETRLTKGMNPTWSPDGALIAFESDRDGNSEIYVMNADGSNVT
jgi:TolB protein